MNIKKLFVGAAAAATVAAFAAVIAVSAYNAPASTVPLGYSGNYDSWDKGADGRSDASLVIMPDYGSDRMFNLYVPSDNELEDGIYYFKAERVADVNIEQAVDALHRTRFKGIYTAGLYNEDGSLADLDNMTITVTDDMDFSYAYLVAEDGDLERLSLSRDLYEDPLAKEWRYTVTFEVPNGSTFVLARIRYIPYDISNTPTDTPVPSPVPFPVTSRPTSDPKEISSPDIEPTPEQGSSDEPTTNPEPSDEPTTNQEPSDEPTTEPSQMSVTEPTEESSQTSGTEVSEESWLEETSASQPESKPDDGTVSKPEQDSKPVDESAASEKTADESSKNVEKPQPGKGAATGDNSAAAAMALIALVSVGTAVAAAKIKKTDE